MNGMDGHGSGSKEQLSGFPSDILCQRFPDFSVCLLTSFACDAKFVPSSNIVAK